ncbi:uncharacterized protein LOC129595670 [Paramacrobiotus metropolitanus]|uniref:uncharacterized protein LOC129595670 n=1 Tax=Paramacrobiotus metropolitanus TaxID=2943436 RepID=UPI0024461DAD|nr:uncharacterized protein LOC129595670 [Paramacrobiotus metropolitanus]
MQSVPLTVLRIVLAYAVLDISRTADAAAHDDASDVFPAGLLGYFVSQEDKAHHVEALSDIMELPSGMDLRKGNVISFEAVQDGYQYCVWFHNEFHTQRTSICIPFQLNAYTVHQVGQDKLSVQMTCLPLTGILTAVIKNLTVRTTLKIIYTPTDGDVFVVINGMRSARYTRTVHPAMFGTFRFWFGYTELADLILRSFNASEPWINATLSLVQGPFHGDSQLAIRYYTRSPFAYHDMELTLHPNITGVPVPDLGLFAMAGPSGNLYVNLGRPTQYGNKKLTFIYDIDIKNGALIQKLQMDGKEARLYYQSELPWHYYGTYEEVYKEPAGNSFTTLQDFDQLDWTRFSSESANCSGKNRRIRIVHRSQSALPIFQEGIFQEGALPIFQEGTCGSVMLPLEISPRESSRMIEDQQFNQIESSAQLGSYSSDPDIQLRLHYKVADQRGSQVQCRFQLMPTAKDPKMGLRVNYTRSDSRDSYGSSSRNRVLRFRRVISPLVPGRYSFDLPTEPDYIFIAGLYGKLPPESTSGTGLIEIRQIGNNTIQWTHTLNGDLYINTTVRFNKDFRIIQGDGKKYWDYSETDGKVVTKTYNADPRVIGTMIFSQEGIAFYHCGDVSPCVLLRTALRMP